ncbi:hypothetical protein V6N13_028945 [Hibiscus sabdariffa]
MPKPKRIKDFHLNSSLYSVSSAHMAAVVDDISRPNTSNPTPKSKGTSRPLGFLIKYYSMLQNGMLADPSFLFKVGTEVGGIYFLKL